MTGARQLRCDAPLVRIRPDAGFKQCNAIDRARGQTELATGAGIGNDRMHLPGGTDNCIDRAGLYAQRAANTCGLVDKGHCRRLGDAEAWIDRQKGDTGDIRQRSCDVIAPRRALIDVGASVCDCLSIRPAAGMSALPALGLWQQCVESVDQAGVSHWFRCGRDGA